MPRDEERVPVDLKTVIDDGLVYHVVGGVEVPKQLGDFWCWAAVTIASIRFVGGLAPDQCALAEAVHEHQGCCTDGRVAEACDLGAEIHAVLRARDVRHVWAFAESLPISALEEAIRSGSLVCALVSDQAPEYHDDVPFWGTTHALLLVGCVRDADHDFWVAWLDPKDENPGIEQDIHFGALNCYWPGRHLGREMLRFARCRFGDRNWVATYRIFPNAQAALGYGDEA
jgi:hypothetical protein